MNVIKSMLWHLKNLGWGPSVLLDLGFLTSYASLHPLGHLLAHPFPYMPIPNELLGCPDGGMSMNDIKYRLAEATPGDNRSWLAS